MMKSPTSILLVQPLYYRQGHFKTYASRLADIDSVTMLNNFCDSPLLAERLEFFYSKIGLNKYIQKVLFSLYVIFTKRLRSYKAVHILEFEYLLYFYILLRHRNLKIIVTVHSCAARRFSLRYLSQLIQKKVLKRKNTIVVFHNSSCSDAWSDLETKVIEYPGGYKGELPDFRNRRGAVVVGILRKDKSILDLLKFDYFNDLKIIGKVVDKKLYKYLSLIDNRYLSKSEYFDVIAGARVLVVPYADKYFGGAGPVMDAIAAGTPILMNQKCYLSSWVVENELGRLYDTGTLYKEFIDVHSHFSESYCEQLYKKGQEKSWSALSDSYKTLYESC